MTLTNDVIDVNDKVDEIGEITFMMDKTNLYNQFNQFVIDNNVSYIKNEMKCIKKIDMHFYQLWSLLGELPILRHGKSKYEWRFIRRDLPNVIFTIYDWNNKNNFLNTKTWYLGSTTKSKLHNKEFVNTFLDGIECYNMYYKGIEIRDFTSDIPIVQENLQRIRSELIQKRNLISFL